MDFKSWIFHFYISSFLIVIPVISLEGCVSSIIMQAMYATHVSRQRKGSVALRVGLLPASFALAGVPLSFGLVT